MDQLPLAILTLMFVSSALCGMFFMAWWTFGRAAHALTWSLMFALAALQWGLSLSLSYGTGFNEFVQAILLEFLGPTVAILSVVGLRQRAEKTVNIPLMAGIVLLTWGGTVWFGYIQPHEGLRASILPYMIVAACLWNMWILYDVPRIKRIVEWTVIAGYGLFATSQLVVGSIAFSQGEVIDEEITQLYVTIAYLTLPTLFTLLGLFVFSLIASDISTRAEVLADYQKRKRREEVEKSWGTVQDAIEAIPDLIAIDDGKGNFLTCNDAMADFLDRDKNELVNMRSLDIISLYCEKFALIDGVPVKAADDVAQKLWHALTTGNQLSVVTSDDRSFIVDCGYLHSGGQILVCRDVTQLYRSQARLETAISSMPIGFALFDKERKLVACNKSYAKILRHDQDWISQQPLPTLWKALTRRLKTEKNNSLVQRSEWLHEWMDAIEKGESHGTTALLDDDTWVDLSVRPVEGEGFVTIANDVTSRRLLELDLEKNEAQLRQILGSQPFPVMLVREADDKILFASDAAIEALDAGTTTLVGSVAADFITGQGTPGSVLERDISAAVPKVQEMSLLRRSGERFPALFSQHAIVYASQEARVVSFIDISNIKELQSELATQREALFQSEKLNALGTLLAGVAHELNNPLTVVVANAHVLELSGEGKGAKSRIQKITAAADRCAKIVRSFLDMARKSPGEKVEFDPVACVEKALELSLYGLKDDKISVEADIAPNLPVIKGDPDQFAQVILNLVINARQALQNQDTPRKIHVAMHLDKSGEAIELHVSDNGSGIPANIRDSIFDPFFTTKKVGEGTGMGLSLVRGIVQSHGGEISLLDQAGPGTHFKITIPHLGHSNLVGIPRQDDRQKVRSMNLLIVDDEPDVLSALEDILVLQGHDVCAVSSGADALTALGTGKFDGILSDIKMPDMNGEQLFDEIQKLYPYMVSRIVFITGTDLSPNTGDFLEACDCPYLGKPFAPEEVYDLLQSLETDRI